MHRQPQNGIPLVLTHGHFTKHLDLRKGSLQSKHLNIATCKWRGPFLYFGVEKATCFKGTVFFLEPCQNSKIPLSFPICLEFPICGPPGRLQDVHVDLRPNRCAKGGPPKSDQEKDRENMRETRLLEDLESCTFQCFQGEGFG